MLKHRVDRPLVGRKTRHIVAEQQDVALRDLFEPRNQTKKRCLAAPRWAEQGEELVVPDGKRDLVKGRHGLRRTRLEDLCHGT